MSETQYICSSSAARIFYWHVTILHRSKLFAIIILLRRQPAISAYNGNAKFLRQRKRQAAAAAPCISHCTLFPRPSQNEWQVFFYHQPDFGDPAVWAHLVYTTFLHLFTQNVRVKITLAHASKYPYRLEGYKYTINKIPQALFVYLCYHVCFYEWEVCMKQIMLSAFYLWYIYALSSI